MSLEYLIDAIHNNHEWVIVDNATLRLLGYNNIKDSDNKKKYKKLLNIHFNKSFEEISKTDKRAHVSQGKDRKVFAVKPMQFIESLKLINTENSKHVIQSITKKDQSQQISKEKTSSNIISKTNNDVTFNKIPFDINSDKQMELMDIYEFVHTFKYNIDRLYIDKFWNGINDDTWIIVDKELLRWIGYNCANESQNKKLYCNILQNNNFELYKDFDIIHTPTDYDERVKCAINTKNTIIVNTRAFEMSLMMVRTRKAGDIRRYFQTLGRIMKDFMMFTRIVNEHNLRLENNQWKREALEYKHKTFDNQDIFDVETNPLVPKEYVYILTSKRYYRKCIFKIGKSIKPDKRLISHNTTAAIDEDTKFYTHVIPTLDCGALEKTLHALLVRYHHSKEWYKLPHAHLLDIVNAVIEQQNKLYNIVNTQLHNAEFDKIKMIPMQQFVDNTSITTEYNKVISPIRKIEKNNTPHELPEQTIINEHLQPEQLMHQQNNEDSKELVRKGLLFNCVICNKKFIVRKTAIDHIISHQK